MYAQECYALCDIRTCYLDYFASLIVLPYCLLFLFWFRSNLC
uniref:Uncharacterized protein n=1 Tax=Anguilla anguilla TaxID=7936 RepID=A0A0E9REK7_ANGAN